MQKSSSYLCQISYVGNNKNLIYYLNNHYKLDRILYQTEDYIVFCFIDDKDNKIINSIYNKIKKINRKIKILNIFYDKKIDELIQLDDIAIERIF
jgi:hypothetical protein